MIATTLEKRKANLIVRISRLDKEESVQQIEAIVRLVEKLTTEKQLEILKRVSRPTRKKLDIGEMIKEQNWKPIDRKEFDRLVKEIDIQEPIEQLIADIRK